MRIEYSSTKLKKKLSDPRLIKRYYTQYAKTIILRLSELTLADDLNEIPHVPPPRRHKLSNGCWGIDYSKNFRIVIKPIGDFNIDDLNTIKAVRILRLEDYH